MAGPTHSQTWIIFVALLYCLPLLAHCQANCPARCRSCNNEEVDCANMSITAPPKSYPIGTSRINLGDNHIRVLGSRSFDTSHTVEMLQLNGNKLTSLRSDSFSFFPNLMTLELTNNLIASIQKRTFRNLRQLRSLILNRNRISSLDFLEDAGGLYELSIVQNKIRSLRENDLASLTILHNLDLRDNLIGSIHSLAFSKLRKLRNLYLNNNPLIQTPQFQFGSEVLQMVDFSHCQLNRVPKLFPASISDLRLGNNKINRVYHTDFLNITDLQLLGLNDNDLAVVDDGALAHLTNLKEVWLRGNNLVYIPRNLPNSVSRIHMDTNNLQQIEAGVFGNNSRLEFLNFESNVLMNILPNTFAGMQFLNGINMQGNQLAVLTRGAFANLTSVSTILLSSNPDMRRIEAGAFQNLRNLTKLHLSHLSREDFDLQENFLPQMMRLEALDLMGSPGLAGDIMAIIDNPSNVSIPLQSLTRLDMSYNNLLNVSQRVRTVFPRLAFFALDQNPFMCTRGLKWLKDWMVSSPRVTFFHYEDLKCNSPARLYGRTLRSIQDNEWASYDEIESDRLLGRTGSELELADEGYKAETSTDVVPEQKPPTRGGQSKESGKQKGKVSRSDKGNNPNKKKEKTRKAGPKQEKKRGNGKDKKKPTKKSSH